ncbi:MAG TPA: HPr kinase/phosphatase C-terminal domain-containing protein [Rhizomicrobium sp.]|nr:HPr kinase/phosphatase C-terminal domain-containing protein [Rhizomicrobium sp.]
MKKPIANIHASCIRLERAGAPFGAPAKAGVLILGESGSGKSLLSLMLIAAGAKLVADDRVELFVRKGRLMARAPANIAGFVEARGVGIVEIPHVRDAAIALVVNLSDTKPSRLPRHGIYEPPKSLLLVRDKWPPMLKLAAADQAAPAKVALAAAAFSQNRFRHRAKGL